MHTSVDFAVDNAAAWLGLFRGAAERVGGQVQPRPAAVDELAEDDDFEERLTGSLGQFVDCRWPRLYLAADPLGGPPEQP